jgi:hypothetical protein
MTLTYGQLSLVSKKMHARSVVLVLCLVAFALAANSSIYEIASDHGDIVGFVSEGRKVVRNFKLAKTQKVLSDSFIANGVTVQATDSLNIRNTACTNGGIVKTVSPGTHMINTPATMGTIISTKVNDSMNPVKPRL